MSSFPPELLAAVLARPADDAPRLVLADWLTERGDPRGEFISAQCELATTSSRARRVELTARVHTLLSAHRADFEPLLDVEVRWDFHRGFPAHVAAPASTLLALPLADLAPLLTAATATRIDVPADALLAWPTVARLTDLALWHLPSDSPTRAGLLGAVGADRRFAHLAGLAVSYSFLDDAAWAAIASSTLLPRLTRLSLDLCNARDEVVDELMQARLQLTSLSLANGRLGTAGAVAIARAETSRSLRNLDLSWNRVGVRGATALAESPHLARLEVLDLSHCQVGDAGAVALAKGMTRLHVLRLQHSRVTERGAEAIRAALPACVVEL